MILQKYVEPPIDNNNYLIGDEVSKECALVDCSHVDRQILDYIKNNNLNLKYILLTHGHFDHVGGVSGFLSTYAMQNNKVPQVLMNENDLFWLKKTNEYLPMFGMPEVTVPNIDKFVNDGDIIQLGDLSIKVLHTPGHTQGGVCYLVEDKLFSGDTIFRESVGRCDLEGGDFDQIVESIKNKIFTLDENISIYPGHGKETNVKWEILYNKFF